MRRKKKKELSYQYYFFELLPYGVSCTVTSCHPGDNWYKKLLKTLHICLLDSHTAWVLFWFTLFLFCNGNCHSGKLAVVIFLFVKILPTKNGVMLLCTLLPPVPESCNTCFRHPLQLIADPYRFQQLSHGNIFIHRKEKAILILAV